MSDIFLSELHKHIEELQEDLISWRRHIHMHPELSLQEYQTAQFVAQQLRAFGVDEVVENFAGSPAVIGLIRGQSEQTVALRADMDALPIMEKTNSIYASRIPGIMHACGHDVHTACLLGAAKVLTSLKEHLPGHVKLIFQPCEEREEGGAKILVQAGVLNNPRVSAIFALHAFPELDVGKVGTRCGQFLAACDVFHITIQGTGTHASRPHLGVDPVVIAAQVINSLHHIISRRVDPLHPAVLTIGRIQGGNAENVIPDEVTMAGTVRTLSVDLRDEIPKWIENTLKGVTQSYGGRYLFEYHHGTSPIINSEQTTRFALASMKEILSPDDVVELEFPSMGGEDFGEYMQGIPGTFIRLGTRNESKGLTAPLHSPLFDIDEEALPIGVKILAGLAFQWLERNTSSSE